MDGDGRQMIEDRTNLVAAASGGGYGHQSCPAGVPVELALLSILAAFGVAFGVLYMALTQITGRRRRRSVDFSTDEKDTAVKTEVDPIFKFADILLFGLEEFEEKVDRIAEGEDDGDDSWISKIYNQFSFFNDDDNSLEENDMDGLEPPLLDETWGLGVRTQSKDNTTVGRNATIDIFEETEEERCRVAMWRCLSRVVERGLHCMESEEGISGYAKKSMFKIVYHGGLTDPMAGLMAVPEARQIKTCMAEHTECISMEILRKEAEETLDPADPMVDMYSKKATVKNKEEAGKEDRVLVNHGFVQGLDEEGGFPPYEEDFVPHDV